MDAIIRAIDIGYGNTKFSYANCDENGNADYMMFPSVAKLTGDESAKVIEGITKRMDLVSVNVEGKRYEVGPDILNTYKSFVVRSIGQDYIGTPEYMALYLGALSLMKVDVIDFLVVGLPCIYMEEKEEYLKNLMLGTHTVADGREVLVKDVYVLPQPMGGFIDYALTESHFKSDEGTKNLTVDVGMYTTDWTLSFGMKVNNEMSGSVEIGVSEALEQIARNISKAFKTTFRDYDAISAACSSGFIRVKGEQHPIDRFLDGVDDIARNAYRAMNAKVGDLEKIDNFFLVGGGAMLFSQALKNMINGRDVYEADKAVFANVRGFQYAGLIKYKNKYAPKDEGPA